MSETMQQYLAGQLHVLPHILPLLAPTVNSYKRLVEGSWAPVRLNWGIDNRTVSFRVLTNGQKSTRLETRIPGADVNPYLTMWGCLASGLYGIKHRLNLQAPCLGNGYIDKQSATLPATLSEATQKMRHSPLAQEILGTDFVDYYTATREEEYKSYQTSVTDWEYRRYFEII
jgi:glutamine synthetase